MAVLIGSLGSVGMWSVVVALPVVQTEFGANRGTASLAFTLVMLGFGLGQVRDRQDLGSLWHRHRDRGWYRHSGPRLYRCRAVNRRSGNSFWCILRSGCLRAATFGPLMAEASHWFERYRGLAVAIAASGNYVGGTIWPPLVNWGIQTYGWRTTHIAIGIFTAVAMALALLGLRMLMGAGARRNHRQCAAAASRLKAFRQCAHRDPGAGEHLLLRGDVDAAGSYRRLLRRSRLWRGARRRNAVADAGLRHHQPHRLGVPGRQDRRHPHAADRFGRAGHRAGCSTCSSTA